MELQAANSVNLPDTAAVHDQNVRPPGDVAESRRIGAGHPDLGAERCERIIERGAPSGIEMRHHLIEQEERRKASHLFDQPRMREDQPDQQRFLLAG